MTKRNGLLRAAALVLLLAALLALLATPVRAVTAEVQAGAEAATARSVTDGTQADYTEESGGAAYSTRSRAVSTYSLKSVANLNVSAYPARSAVLNWVSLGVSGRLINGEVYLPIRAFVERFVGGASVAYNSRTKTLTVTGAGHNISVSDGAYALYANGRVFFAATPARVLSDGRMYAPVSTLSKAFSLTYSVSAYGTARLFGTPRAVESGDSYYDADVLYWLSRIISAESRGEPLIGQIAVGDVVLNRTRSSAFPNSVYGVIFDRKYGVQFSPVSNGTIYEPPTASAILAAKICLDGFTVSDRVLYFLRPSASSSSWIVNNREFLFVIGNHYFFA